MNLSPKARKIAETVAETVIGLAVATPVLLASTGVGTKVGAGATLLAVSVGVTNLTSVPAVERFLDRLLGNGGEAQLLSLQAELQGVESVVAEHFAAHPAAGSPVTSEASSTPAAPAAPTAESAPTADGSTHPADPSAS